MGRGRSTPRRTLLVLAAILALAGAGFGAFLLFRPDAGRERRERAMRAGRALEDGRFEEARVLLLGLVQDDPRNSTLRHNLAIALLRLDQPGPAENVVRETLRIDPEHLPSHQLLSGLAREAGRLPEAIREARIALDLAGGDTPSRYRLAELLLDAGRRTEALAVLTEAAGRADADEGLTVRLASLLEQMDPGSATAVRAKRHLDGILRSAREKLAGGTPEPDQVVGFAELALRAGRPEEALLALTAVPVKRPLTRPEKLLLARACSAAGRHRRAMEILDELGVDPDPEDLARPNVALARATVLLQSDEPGRALDTLAPALAAYPNDVGLVLTRLLALQRQHLVHGDALVDPAALEDAATRLLELRPEAEQALRIRAAARIARGHPGLALADASALRRIDPDSPHAAWLTGLGLLGLGREAAATPLLREGLRALPTPSEGAPVLLRAALRSGDEEALRAAIAILPDGFPALRAAAAMATGDVESATALAATPEFAAAPRGDVAIAAFVFAAHDRPQAARRLAGAIAPDASGPERMLRANLLLAAGDREAALADLRALADSDAPSAAESLSRLAEILRPDVEREAAERETVIDRLAAVPGGANAARVLRGRGELATGSPAAALAHADTVLAESPEDAAALELRLLALNEKGSPLAELLPAAEALLAIIPTHSAARLLKARGLLAAVREGRIGPDVDRNAAALDEAVGLAPGDPATRLLRGIAQAELGDLETAEADAMTLIASAGSPGSGEYLLGIVRYRQSRLPESAEQFRLAARTAADAPDALIALGQVHLAMRDPEAALAVAAEIEARSGSAPALPLRAAALLALGRTDEAVDLVSAPASPAEDPGRLLLRARVLDAAGRPGEAARAWEALVRLRPDRLGVRAGLVHALLRAERTADALAAAQAVAREERFGHHGRLLLAMTRDASGDGEGALAALRDVLRDEPESTLACRLLGQMLIAGGRTREGAEFLRRATALDPREVPSRLRLALLAEAEGRDEEATALYEEILAVAPTEVLAANNLAFRLAGRPGQEDRAVRLARRAVARFPAEGEFRDTLARALAASGEPTAAAEEAGKAMELAATSPWVAIRAAEIFRDADMPDRAREAAARAEERASPAELDEIRRRVRNLLGTLRDR